MIAKCTDRGCKSRKTCLLYVTPSKREQHYADYNRPDGADKCESYKQAELPKEKTE